MKNVRKISLATKLFSIFFVITALDISLIYIFTATGQIDQIGRNGLLIAENAALKLVQTLRGVATTNLMENRLWKHKISTAAEVPMACATIGPDGRNTVNPASSVAPRALKALRLFEAEGRLFYVDLARGDFSADIFVPFRNSATRRIEVLACQLPLTSIRESLDRLLRISLILLVVTLVLQAALGWFIYALLVKRFRKLEMATVKIAQGDFSESLDIGKRSDEIDRLAATFDDMRVALAEKSRVLEETLLHLEKANFDLEGDLLLGEEIQQSILPEKTSGKRIAWCVTYRPHSKVSGDLYDVYDLPNGDTGVLLFDASGHGVPASLLTMLAKTAFVEAIQKTAAPHEVLAHVNDELSAHLQKTGNFLTAFFAVIGSDGKMVYCNAAHTITVVVRAAGSCELLLPTSLSIGFAPPGTSAFSSAHTSLKPGDRVVVYTDGLTETITKAGSPLDTTGLVALLESCARLDLRAMHTTVYAMWQSQVAEGAIEDDVTLFTFALR